MRLSHTQRLKVMKLHTVCLVLHNITNNVIEFLLICCQAKKVHIKILKFMYTYVSLLVSLDYLPLPLR